MEGVHDLWKAEGMAQRAGCEQGQACLLQVTQPLFPEACLFSPHFSPLLSNEEHSASGYAPLVEACSVVTHPCD